MEVGPDKFTRNVYIHPDYLNEVFHYQTIDKAPTADSSMATH